MDGFPKSEPALSRACCAGPDSYLPIGKFQEAGISSSFFQKTLHGAHSRVEHKVATSGQHTYRPSVPWFNFCYQPLQEQLNFMSEINKHSQVGIDSLEPILFDVRLWRRLDHLGEVTGTIQNAWSRLKTEVVIVHLDWTGLLIQRINSVHSIPWLRHESRDKYAIHISKTAFKKCYFETPHYYMSIIGLQNKSRGKWPTPIALGRHLLVCCNWSDFFPTFKSLTTYSYLRIF